MPTSLILQDSEGKHLGLIIDPQGDILIFDADNTHAGSKFRFCGPGGDACYALEVRRALRDLFRVVETEIEKGNARGRVIEPGPKEKPESFDEIWAAIRADEETPKRDPRLRQFDTFDSQLFPHGRPKRQGP